MSTSTRSEDQDVDEAPWLGTARSVETHQQFEVVKFLEGLFGAIDVSGTVQPDVQKSRRGVTSDDLQLELERDHWL